MAAYAPAPAGATVLRQGSKLLIAAPLPGRAVDLPPVCVRCGAPSNGKPVKKTFSWHHPGLYALLVSPIIYIIVAAIVRKMIKVNVPLCAQHAQRRTTAMIFAWLLPVIGFADIFVLAQFQVDPGYIVLIFIACVVAGLVIWAVGGNAMRPTLIDKTHGEFSGCCELFLQQFAEGTLQTVVFTQYGPPPTRGAPPHQGPPPPPAIG